MNAVPPNSPEFGAFGEASPSDDNSFVSLVRLMAEDDSGPVSTWLAELARARVPEEDLVGLAPGDVVGAERYRICRELGRGGMGVVYEATDTKLNRQVALKTHQTGSSAARALLLVEAQAMAKLSHPNVVAVHDVGEFEDGVFLVAELVTGGNLKTWRVPDRDWSEVVRAYVEAGRGLAYAHECGLVHRDFKPGNVLLTEGGRCQVADFGIAVSSALSDDAEATRPDERKEPEYNQAGTPAYMAPELLLDVPADARSDQFSFCVALYEALLGQRPFEKSSRELLEGKPRERPRGTAPQRVVRLLERGFSVRPADRFPTMAALLDCLEQTLEPRRMGWLAIGAAGLVGTATWTALAEAQPPCEVDPTPLRSWSPEGQAALEAVFDRDRRAALLWPAMARSVDDFVGAWIETSTSVCSDGSYEPFRLEAQRCLDEVRRDAEATLASLRHASKAATRGALQRAQAWTSPSTCLRTEFVSASQRTSWLLRPRHRAAHQRLREISNAIDSGGDLVVLSGQLDALRPEIAALDDHGLRGRLALAEAGIALRTDRRELEPLLKRAYHEARSGDDDFLATTAANSLTQLFALELGDVKAALEWGEVARVEAQRRGVPPELTVRTELVVAIAYDVAGQWSEAAEGYTRALATAEILSGERRERERANILTSVSGFEVARGNVERALSTGTEAVETFERLDGGPSPSSFAAMGNVGLALDSMGRLDEAKEMFERELALRVKLLGPDHPGRLPALLNLGMVADHQHRPEEARRYWLDADALVLKHYGERQPDRGDIALSLGWQDMDEKRYEAAIDRFVWAKDVFEETVGTTAEQTFLAHVALTSARLALGLRERACDPVPGLVRDAREALGENRAVARLLRVQGDCAEATGDLTAAVSAFRESWTVGERVSDTRSELLDTRLALAEVLSLQGSGDEARRLAKEVAEHTSTSPTTRAAAEAMLTASDRSSGSDSPQPPTDPPPSP